MSKQKIHNLGIGVYKSAFLEGLAPDPELTISEWADQFRILPSFAAESGHYRTARTPYNKEIMDVLSPSSPVERVVFMKSAQVGGTDVGLNFLGFIMHLAPSSILMIQPTDQDAESVSKERIDPMIEAIPELRSRVAPTKERSSKNTILYKNFTSGFLAMVGANAPTKLRSRGIRYIFADEVSAYKKSAGKEGDPLALVERRTTTYARRKIFLNSTPTIKYECRIEEEYEKSDQRRFFVPCPHCNHMQYLKWGGPECAYGIKWDDDKPETAKYMCENCTTLIDEVHKGMMLSHGEWRATAEGDGTVGFHISALYSPPGWRKWAGMVKAFLAAREKRDPELLKVFVNTELGETWEEDYSVKVGADALESRCEFYKPYTAPPGVLVVIASVDVQDNRLGCSLYGYGVDEETWFLGRQEYYGDPAQDEVWRNIDEIINNPIPHDVYGKIDVWACGVDSGGHHTHRVYQYVRPRKAKRVFAVKGVSIRNKPAIGKPTKQDINYKGQVLKSGVDLYPVGTDTIKTLIYARLKNTTPGPGYFHFHMEAKHEYFEQLTSEKQVSRRVGTRYERTWVKKKPSVRNEGLDECVYNYAVLQLLYTHYRRETVWQQLQKKLEDKAGISQPKPEQTKDVLPAPQKQNTLKRVTKSFVRNY